MKPSERIMNRAKNLRKESEYLGNEMLTQIACNFTALLEYLDEEYALEDVARHELYGKQREKNKLSIVEADRTD